MLHPLDPLYICTNKAVGGHRIGLTQHMCINVTARNEACKFNLRFSSLIDFRVNPPPKIFCKYKQILSFDPTQEGVDKRMSFDYSDAAAVVSVVAVVVAAVVVAVVAADVVDDGGVIAAAVVVAADVVDDGGVVAAAAVVVAVVAAVVVAADVVDDGSVVAVVAAVVVAADVVNDGGVIAAAAVGKVDPYGAGPVLPLNERVLFAAK